MKISIVFTASILFIVLLQPQAGAASAQRPAASTGTILPSRPLVRTYSPMEFGAAPSNWAIVQDKRGVMYFGDAEGVLEYDGVSWRKISTPNRSMVRSLAIGHDDRIYVGELGAFGCLTPDSVGYMRFVSLLDKGPPEERDFPDVLSAQVTAQGGLPDPQRSFFSIRKTPCVSGDPRRDFNLHSQCRIRFSSIFAQRPALSVSTKNLGTQVEIRIRDNGNGIPQEVRQKIFTPFFTTKPTGQGTGLGLSISHDIIVQQHHGDIAVETEEGKFTEFVINLPKSKI